MHEKPKNPLSILVIEDNEMFCRLAIDMLSVHHTISASDAESGLKKYAEKKPDIVFLDIGLPDANGHEVLKEIKKIDPNAFVVMLTASSIKEDVQKSLEAGARGYIIKPFSRKQVKENIDKYYSEHK